MPFFSEVRLNVLKPVSSAGLAPDTLYIYVDRGECASKTEVEYTSFFKWFMSVSHCDFNTEGQFHFFTKRKNTPSCKRSTVQINPISAEINLSCQEGRGVIPFVKWLLNLCFRLRCLVKQLERGEASLTDLKKNLEYAASVLESVYIEETRWEKWSSGHGDKFWPASFMGNNSTGLTKARLWKMGDSHWYSN